MPSIRNFVAPLALAQYPAAWVDSLQMAANTAKSYTVPTDNAGRRATLLRMSGTSQKSGELYYNCFGTAALPSGDRLDGTASPEAVGPSFMLAVPNDCTAISFLATTAGQLVIEAWGE